MAAAWGAGGATTSGTVRCSLMRGTDLALAGRLIREGVEAFIADGALTRGAAIAFYGVTAIAPTLYIAVTVASLGFGRDQARGAIFQLFGHLMSPGSLEGLRL